MQLFFKQTYLTYLQIFCYIFGYTDTIFGKVWLLAYISNLLSTNKYKKGSVASAESTMQKTNARNSLPVCRTCSSIKARPLDVEHSVQIRRINVTKQLYDIHWPRLEIQQHGRQVRFYNDITCYNDTTCKYSLNKEAWSLLNIYTMKAANKRINKLKTLGTCFMLDQGDDGWAWSHWTDLKMKNALHFNAVELP